MLSWHGPCGVGGIYAEVDAMEATPTCSRDGWLDVPLEQQVQRLGNEGLDPGVLLGRENAELAPGLGRDLGIKRDALALRRVASSLRARSSGHGAVSLVPQLWSLSHTRITAKASVLE